MSARREPAADFNLRTLVREVCAETDLTSPELLAKEVGRRIKRSDRDAALEQALLNFVLTAVSRHRSPVEPVAPSAAPAAGPSPRKGGQSAKVAAIRGLARMLRDRVSVGPGPSEWKFLADCTADDLTYAEELRRKHAQHVLAHADQYARIRALLEQHDVGTVGELPEPVLATDLDAAA